jgi:hypothetical protein
MIRPKWEDKDQHIPLHSAKERKGNNMIAERPLLVVVIDKYLPPHSTKKEVININTHIYM